MKETSYAFCIPAVCWSITASDSLQHRTVDRSHLRATADQHAVHRHADVDEQEPVGHARHPAGVHRQPPVGGVEHDAQEDAVPRGDEAVPQHVPQVHELGLAIRN